MRTWKTYTNNNNEMEKEETILRLKIMLSEDKAAKPQTK